MWSGELSASAKAILHQHAVQGDITDAQHAIWYIPSCYSAPVAETQYFI